MVKSGNTSRSDTRYFAFLTRQLAKIRSGSKKDRCGAERQKHLGNGTGNNNYVICALKLNRRRSDECWINEVIRPVGCTPVEEIVFAIKQPCWKRDETGSANETSFAQSRKYIHEDALIHRDGTIKLIKHYLFQAEKLEDKIATDEFYVNEFYVIDKIWGKLDFVVLYNLLLMKYYKYYKYLWRILKFVL